MNPDDPNDQSSPGQTWAEPRPLLSRLNPRRFVIGRLRSVDVGVDGKRDWDLHVHDDRFYGRLLRAGSLAMGESYMDGWWDCRRLDEMIHRILRGDLKESAIGWSRVGASLRASFVNLQSVSRAFQVGQRHYDIGEDLFRRMLDQRMVYSCAYWNEADDLDAAQEAKLDLICRKLGLQPGMKVLDIGCGWGGTLQYAAERYGVEGVGVTISRDQAEHARRRCGDLPIEIRLQDYRELQEPFDRILSVGMFEHVGVRNYRVFMQVVRRCLDADGLFLLHTIGSNSSNLAGDVWMDRYIFPNAKLPSVRQIAEAAEGLFVLEDWHNIGANYDPTLMAWHANLEPRWDEIPNYDERFRRMWRYYLLACAGSFRARANQVWQIVLSPGGVSGGYRAQR